MAKVPLSYERLKENFRYIRWGIVLSALLIIILFLGWWFLFHTHTKVLTGINYYRYPIIVELDNTSYEIDTFEFYQHETTSLGEMKLTISDKEGKKLETRTHNLTVLPGISMDIFSAENGIKLCPVELDVTELYYPADESETRQAYLQQELANEPTNSVYFEYAVLPTFSKLVYLGEYDGTELPDNVSTNTKVHGVYFVECKNKDDSEKLTEEAVWWNNYDPINQRELYEKRVSELEKTSEYKN